MLTDPIADLFTRIRNATMVLKNNCTVSYSNQKWMILTVLKQTGYITDFQKIKLDKNRFNSIVIQLKYYRKTSVIRHIQRISKPGLKLYTTADKMPKIHNNLGIVIVSTSKGIMTGIEAKKNNVGGKLIASVW